MGALKFFVITVAAAAACNAANASPQDIFAMHCIQHRDGSDKCVEETAEALGVFGLKYISGIAIGLGLTLCVRTFQDGHTVISLADEDDDEEDS